jgi:DNA ligase-1
VHNAEEFALYEDNALSIGAEGVMIRSPNGRYKQGRSTLKEQILLKKKVFSDSEFTVVGFKEKMHNANEAKVNELGHTSRSTHKENLIPASTLGAIVVHSDEFGTFDVGTGFDDKLRKEIWENKDQWVGALVKVKYFKTDNADYQIRFPVYLGRRMEEDQ